MKILMNHVSNAQQNLGNCTVQLLYFVQFFYGKKL